MRRPLSRLRLLTSAPLLIATQVPVPLTAPEAVPRDDVRFLVGRVENINSVLNEEGGSDRGRANGVLVSPCFMLTNAHAVFGKDLVPNIWNEHKHDYDVNFFFGQGEKVFRWKLRGTPVEWGMATALRNSDFALVKIQRCPGRRLGYLSVDDRPLKQILRARVTMISIDPKQTNALLTKEKCRLLGIHPASGLVRHGCSSTAGLSGSPVLSEGGKLVGIHVGDLPNGVSLMYPVAKMLENRSARSVLDLDLARCAKPSSAMDVDDENWCFGD